MKKPIYLVRFQKLEGHPLFSPAVGRDVFFSHMYGKLPMPISAKECVNFKNQHRIIFKDMCFTFKAQQLENIYHLI
jgi:hypothetical protein